MDTSDSNLIDSTSVNTSQDSFNALVADSTVQNFNIPSDPNEIQAFLHENGITLSLTSLKSIGRNYIDTYLEKFGSKYTEHQKQILKAVRNSMKGPMFIQNERFEQHKDEIERLLRENNFPPKWTAQHIKTLDFSRFQYAMKVVQKYTDDEREVIKKCVGLIKPDYIKRLEGGDETTSTANDDSLLGESRDHEKTSDVSMGISNYRIPKKRPSTNKNITDWTQELLKKHDLDISIDDLLNMDLYKFRSFLLKSVYSDEQKEVLRQIRKKHTSSKASSTSNLSTNHKDSSDNDTFQQSVSSFKDDPSIGYSSDESIDSVKEDIPDSNPTRQLWKKRRYNDDELQDLLRDHGLSTFSLQELQEMDSKRLKRSLSVGQFSDEQKRILTEIRRRLRNRMHTQKRRRMANEKEGSIDQEMDHSSTTHIQYYDTSMGDEESIDFSHVHDEAGHENDGEQGDSKGHTSGEMNRIRADEEIKKKLKEHDLDGVRPEDLRSMEIANFQKYLAEGHFSEKQKDVLRYIRTRIRSRRTKMLYYHKRKSTKESFNEMSIDSPSSTEIPSAAKAQPPTSTLSHLQQILNANKIDFEIEHLKPMDKHTFQEMLQYTGFTQGQQEILKHVKEQLINMRYQKASYNQDAPKKIDMKSLYKDGKFHLRVGFTEDEATEALKLLGVKISAQKLARLGKEFVEWRDANCTSDKQKEAVMYVRRKLKDRRKAKESYQPKKVHTPEDPSSIDVQNLPNGHKRFTKSSTFFPDHSYTYRFKRQIPKGPHSNEIVDVYECDSCIEVTKKCKTEEAKKCIMEYLKTVQVLNGKIVDGDYDGLGHVCVPLVVIKKKYGRL